MGQLKLLHESPELQQPAHHIEEDGGVFGLLEDLQEAIYHYQVCSEPKPLLNINKDNRPHSNQ